MNARVPKPGSVKAANFAPSDLQAATPARDANSSGAKSTVRPRSRSRMAAVQALYQMDLAGTDLDAVIEDFTQVRFAAGPSAAADAIVDADANDALVGADAQFFAELLRGVVRRQRDIDPLVDAQLAAGWRLARVDSILRATLRSGTFELLERADIPSRVIINEYVDVAKAFFHDDEPKVVNGVFDKLARRLRPEEFQNRG
jgi:transcription antitermination protein NusB